MFLNKSSSKQKQKGHPRKRVKLERVGVGIEHKGPRVPQRLLETNFDDRILEAEGSLEMVTFGSLSQGVHVQRQSRILGQVS